MKRTKSFMMVKKLKIDGHTLPSCLQKNYNNVVSPLTVKYLDNDEWVQSVFLFFLPFPTNGNAQFYSNNITIVLINHCQMVYSKSLLAE